MKFIKHPEKIALDESPAKPEKIKVKPVWTGAFRPLTLPNGKPYFFFRERLCEEFSISFVECSVDKGKREIQATRGFLLELPPKVIRNGKFNFRWFFGPLPFNLQAYNTIAATPSLNILVEEFGVHVPFFEPLEFRFLGHYGFPIINEE